MPVFSSPSHATIRCASVPTLSVLRDPPVGRCAGGLMRRTLHRINVWCRMRQSQRECVQKNWTVI